MKHSNREIAGRYFSRINLQLPVPIRAGAAGDLARHLCQLQCSSINKSAISNRVDHHCHLTGVARLGLGSTLPLRAYMGDDLNMTFPGSEPDERECSNIARQKNQSRYLVLFNYHVPGFTVENMVAKLVGICSKPTLLGFTSPLRFGGKSDFYWKRTRV